MQRSHVTSSRSSASTLVLAVLACCGGTAGAAGLALELLDSRATGGWGVPLVLGCLVGAALALVVWVLVRRGRESEVVSRLPTLVLAPEPRDDAREPPRVLRVAHPLKAPQSVSPQGGLGSRSGNA